MKAVFDTEALLAFYLGEKGGERVTRLLVEVQRGELEGHLNVVNLAEFYYILYRRSPKIAEEKERNLRGYGLKIAPVTDNRLWRTAAKMKGEHALSLADAFAAATAKMKGATLITGRDKEFENTGIKTTKIRN